MTQIHIFPEGKVNQPRMKISDGLMRFKWGVSQMVLRSEQPPVIIPMYLQGFDNVMPEDRTYLKFLPKLGKKITVSFGSPAGITHEVQGALQEWRKAGTPSFADPLDPEAAVRSRIAEILRNAVHNLGDSLK
ncbi:hypothetical protein FRC03_007587 [Tulasnella sp. 419]|nr:hypothetical protein FRC02_011358 [Tulasnella sp. 418]KAG8968390.1 hypothetical protein FRC03_007587 [Tulasnella sp. 419]